MKYAFIDSQKVAWPVTAMCEALGVSKSGYYDWLAEPITERERRDVALASKVRAIFGDHRGRYGSPRVAEELRADGEVVNEKRVARIMRETGLVARSRKRFVATTDSSHQDPIAPNLLARNFTTDAPRVQIEDGYKIQPSDHRPDRRHVPDLDPTYTYVDDGAVLSPPLISNSGFESGTLTSWTTSGQSATISTTSAYSGTHSAMLGSTSATNGDSSMEHTFTVPLGGGTLSFWYSNVCPDTVTYDWFTATLQNLQNPSGQTLATIVPNTCASSSAWTQATLDLASWAGQTVMVVLTSHDDNYPGDPTYTYVDDVTAN